MKHRKKKPILSALLPLLAAGAALLVFSLAVSNVDLSRREQGRVQLEEALRRTAAACYAAEGAYPPSLEYMCSHYAIRYNEEEYTVIYDRFASNLMPDITVLSH